jgi:hypothetical protein
MSRAKTLTAYVARVARLRFQWGQHDCAIFAAGAVEALTGRDLAAPYRGRYSTMRGGLRVIRRDGFADHAAYFAAHLPEKTRPTPGDLAVIPTPDGPAMGVVQGAHVYVLSPEGLRLVPLAAAQRFFEV